MTDELQKMDDSWLLHAIMDNVSDSIYFKDRQCRILLASQWMANTNGMASPKDLIGLTDYDLYGEEFGQKTQIDDLHVMETGQPLIGLVESHMMDNGEVNWTSTSKLPLRNEAGEIIGILGITREINDLKRTELDLQHIATHDILTGLPNRYLFFNRLEHAIRRAKRSDMNFAVLYIDLDHFKIINDRLGHDAGDHMLKEVGSLLNSVIRDSDTVARIGGDEFVLLVENIQNKEEPAIIAKRILDELNQNIKFHTVIEKIGASIGISLYPQDGKDAASLIKAADHAMYQAKSARNSWQFFTLPKKPE